MSSYSIVVLRIDRGTGQLTSSKPCNECLSMLKFLNMKYVHYSTADGQLITERIKDATSTFHTSYARKRVFLAMK